MVRKKHALLIGIDRYRHLEEKDLEGAHNDVIELYGLLRHQFAFPKSQIVGYIDDEESTRDVLIGAFEALCTRVERDDVVVISYSGHGSRGPRGERMIESLVPADSGRPSPDGDGSPGRDIFDFEVNAYLERLRRTTPWLTVIFDCCHSGAVTRDPFVSGVRQVQVDPRPGLLPAGELQGDWRGHAGSSGVTLAACRAEQLAEELRVGDDGEHQMHGAFTYHLCRTLADAPPGATWRGILEEVAPRVSARFPSQQPQIEGARNTVPFGVETHRPRAYVQVVGFKEGRAALAAGAAHGLSLGSQWSLHSSEATHPTAATELARVRVEEVRAGASSASVESSADIDRLGPGLRAFPHQQRAEQPGLRVHLFEDGVAARDVERLRRYIERSGLLAPESSARADVALRLSAGQWQAIGTDGRFLVRSRPDEGTAIPGLVQDLETVARYRNLLEIENRAEVELRRGVDLKIMRRSGGDFIEAQNEPGAALPFFAFGEHMEIIVENRLDRPLWASLLHFGCDFSIDLLLPHRNHRHFRPGSVRLEPESSLALAREYHSDSVIVDLREGFELQRPEDFPWIPPDASQPGQPPGSSPTDSSKTRPGGPDEARGLVHLRLMVTDSKADFEFLTGARARDPGIQAHPLLELSRLYASGQGQRDLPNPEMSWAVISRAITVGDRGHSQ